jgi:hypothetical protein
MKKLITLSTIIIIGLSSCKRDYLCSCKYSDEVNNKEIYNTSKADAKAECLAKETEIRAQIWHCTLY